MFWKAGLVLNDNSQGNFYLPWRMGMAAMYTYQGIPMF